MAGSSHADKPASTADFTHNKQRLDNTNPEGIYSGIGLRNAIQGEGFVPETEPEIFGERPAKKSKLRHIR